MKNSEWVRLLEQEDNIGIVAINAGGNNRTIGSKPDGTPWRVRIQNPDGGDKLMIVSKEDNCSFVTSGDYERYYEADDGKRYHHIIDPKTGYSANNGLISVTIISDQSVDGDALSTTCFALGLDEGLKFAEKKDVQAVFITEDYELHYTNGFQDEIKVTDVES